MKRLNLLFISLVLGFATISAQKSLPLSMQPYSVNWGYSVKQMLNAAGYEVPGPKAEFDLREGRPDRTGDVVLDSTITYYGFNLSGGEAIPLFRNVYTYPDPGVEVILESYFENDAWVPLSRTSLVSDELGRMVETIAQRYDPESGEFVPDSRIELFPRGNSMDNVDSFFVYAWSAEVNDYVRQIASWNTYNAQERLSLSISSIEIFEFPLLFKDAYTYDASGNLVLVESYNIDGTEEIPGGIQELQYNHGQLATVTDFVTDGLGGFLPRELNEYTYHPSGYLWQVKSFEWDFEKDTWKPVQQDAYGYDGDNRITSLIRVRNNPDGTEEKQQTTYTYTLDHNIAFETGYVWNEEKQDYEVSDKKHYYYNTIVSDEPVDPVVADALFMYPNPTSGMVQVKLGGRISVQIYTISGQLVRKYAMSPGEKFLNLSDLPAGIYQVRAKSDEDYFSGKLLIQ